MSSLYEKKTVSTTLPKFSRPVVRKFLDQGPELSQIYETSQNVIFTPNILPPRRIHFSRPCRKILSQRLKFFVLYVFHEFFLTLSCSSQRVGCSFNEFLHFFRWRIQKFPLMFRKKLLESKVMFRKLHPFCSSVHVEGSFYNPVRSFVSGAEKNHNFQNFLRKF